MKIFCDVESTGFSPWSNSIIACAMIKIDGDTVSKLITYGAPESIHQWGDKAEEIHGIPLVKAVRFQHHSLMLNEILDFIDKPVSEFWYHGKGKFDYKFLLAAFCKINRPYDFIRLVDISRVKSTAQLAKESLQLPNFKLNTVCDYYNIELNHHEVFSDAKACYQIWRRLNEN